jgi:LCP family protein required for cell wall assembly
VDGRDTPARLSDPRPRVTTSGWAPADRRDARPSEQPRTRRQPGADSPPRTVADRVAARERVPARASAGRTSGRPTGPAVTDRPPGRIARRVRIGLVIASALVFALTGAAWGLYRDVTAGITTTQVVSGDGGDQNILLVGVDSRTDAQGNPLPPQVQAMLNSGPDSGVLNSDTIILLHIPEGGGAAVAFSIPRDSYVDIPDYRRDKINAAYPAVKALTAQDMVHDGVSDRARIETASSEAGRRALIAAVQDLTGVVIDHYAEINLLGFYNLTTAIGGVDVCLKNPVDDDLSGAHFGAGPQTIQGAAALSFVRQRHGLPEGDLSRIRRQQAFMAAVAEKVLDAGTLTDPGKLASLVGVVQQSVVIDADWDLLGFAHQAADIAGGNLEFLTIPTRGTENNNRGDVVLVDPGQVKDFVEQRSAALTAAAEPTAEPAPTAPPLDIKASRYVVDVRNGSKTAGLASDIATHTRGLGFLPGTVDNTSATGTSVVRYASADADAASAVAAQLGDIDTEESDSQPRGHLLVVAGDDFDPRTVAAPASPAPTPAPAPTSTGAPITAAGAGCVD